MDLILVTQHILFGYSESRLISAQHEVRTLRSLRLFFSTFFESLRMQSNGEGAINLLIYRFDKSAGSFVYLFNSNGTTCSLPCV